MSDSRTDRELAIQSGTPAVGSETPVTELGRFTGLDAAYQTVATWTVTASKTGKLKEISIVTDDFVNTLWRITVGATVIITDGIIQRAYTIPYDDFPLSAAQVVLIEAHSNGVDNVIADGSITGVEVGA